MTKPRVWVFGAGITGLTAAHELAERGYLVTVVECEWDQGRDREPAVGGMAKTQWGAFLVPPETTEAANSTSRPMGRVDGLLPPLRVQFEKDKADKLVDSSEADLTAYIEKVKTTYSLWKPQLRVRGFFEDGVEAADLVEKREEYIKLRLKDVAVVTNTSASLLPTEDVSLKRADIFCLCVPAEHGFRYFPAFYRHVFNTMGRIRLRDEPQRRPTSRPFPTVLDNLVPTKTVVVAVEAQNIHEQKFPSGDVKIPRELPRSLREIQNVVLSFIEHLGYEADDLAHLAKKITQYMTSGGLRRRSYEQLTWQAFLDTKKLSARCQDHMERAPEILGGMVASESDARTQGNSLVQLLINQITGSKFSDATLNAPSTSAWFAPWREYLKAQNVQFVRGKLSGFESADDKDRKRTVIPVLTDVDPRFSLPPSADDYFVVAVSLQAMLPTGSGEGALGLCSRFLEKCQGDAGDFEALNRWINAVGADAWKWDKGSPGPFRQLSGIQFYFDTDVHPRKGHTIYLDSAWRLSSISPLSFWTRERTSADGYRGIVSVDVGEWCKPGGRTRGDSMAKNSTRDEIANEVWRQVTATLDDIAALEKRGQVPRPQYYHLDDSIVLGANEKPTHNKAPYLITRPQDWPYRPGDPSTSYKVACDRWVLAGTYMQTFTRLTTMESANESARHAVNALLDKLDFQGPRCEIWNPESAELRDLDDLKAIDDRLMSAGLPHAIEILDGGSMLEIAMLLPLGILG